MTNNSETPFLHPPSPNTSQLVSTPRSARPTTPSRQSQSPTKLYLSPIKSRNTPGRSPRRSPSKTFQNVKHVKSVSFTPQRTRQPPRAWERRPATPFVPRDEKQKIWKRVPLGELGVDINQPTGISRREQEAGKDYARVVKKLKVGHDGEADEDEDKENVIYAVDTKVQSDEVDLKRRGFGMSRGQNYVAMKMVGDEIQGSPKKKLRQPTIEGNPHIEGEEEEQGDTVASEEEDMSDDALQSGNEQAHTVTSRDQNLEHTLSAESEGDQGKFDNTKSIFEAVEQRSGPLSENSEGDKMTDHESMDATDRTEAQERSGIAAAPSVVGQAVTSQIDDFDAPDQEKSDGLQIPQQPAAQSDLAETVEEASKDEMQLPVSRRKSTLESEELPNHTEATRMAPACQRAAADEETIPGEIPGSSSPPTILVENVTIDELEARDLPSPSRYRTNTEAQSGKEAGDIELSDGVSIHDTLSRRVSHDEAAFLREFMSRTKASKADHAAAQVQAIHSDTHLDSTKTNAEQQQTVETGNGGVQVPTLEPTSQDNALPASPLRRSKRAAVTSIPRPQGLPNSIQLKRANGTEFIFKANEASSTVNVAVSTRTNTKKNKGTALNVPARLEQLLAHKNKEEVSEAEVVAVEADSTEDKANKKRKRTKNDIGRKAKKVLRWNDGNLVSYQEAERNPGWEEVENSSQEDVRGKENGDVEKHIKLTLTLTPGSGEADSTEHDNKIDQAVSKPRPQQKEQKVRRVRRSIAGSINGTPAPKTRSRTVIDSDEMDVPVEEGVQAGTSAAVAAAAEKLASEGAQSRFVAPSTSTRKSRMPVPTSSRRGAVASASTRTAASSMSAQIRTGGENSDEKKRRVDAKAHTEKAGQEGDILGRRRLRVRS